MTTRTSTNSGTVPYTVLQAVAACRERRKCDEELKFKAAAASAPSRPPVDLLAVVLNVERIPSRSHVRLTIGDQSLQPSKQHSAQVLLFGRTNYDSIVDVLKIQPGDVMRFNRVDLQLDRDGRSTTKGFVFWHSIHDPDLGPAFFRLCHVDADHSGQATALPCEYDVCRGVAVPSSMQTSPSCVQELIDWYRSSYLSGNGNSISTTLSSLHSLPCTFRTLAEFHACTGMVGHVVAKVVQVTRQSPDSSATKKHLKRKRKHQQRTLPGASLITLTDDNSTTCMVLYLDHSNSVQNHESLHQVLHSAQREQKLVRLSRVVAQSAIALRNPDDVMLVPSSHTTAAFATSDETALFHSRIQRPLNATHSSQTQDYQRATDDPLNDKGSRESFIAHSRIHDMTVKDTSLVHSTFLDDLQSSSPSTARSLRSLLTNDKSYIDVAATSRPDGYSSACLTLSLGAFDDTIEAHANGAIVKTLFGGLELDEWLPLLSSSRQATNESFLPIVQNMIRSLLADGVELRWEIHRPTNPSKSNVAADYEILRVSLPSL